MSRYRRCRGRAASAFAAALIGGLLWQAAARGGEAPPPAPAPALPPSFYLVSDDGLVPLAEGRIARQTDGDVTYYRVPLQGVAETRSPLKVLDAYPSDGPNFYVLAIGDDGLVFSWDRKIGFFRDEIRFHPFFDAIDERKVMVWNEIAPGLYAFVENTTVGIGEICFPFRVVP